MLQSMEMAGNAKCLPKTRAIWNKIQPSQKFVPKRESSMKKMTLRTLPAMLAVLFSGAASAGAFQLWEQSASGLGNAYAGSAAVASDAGTVFYNPAGLTQLSGFQVSTGVAGVGPSYEFRNNASSGAGMGAGNGGNAGSWAAVPNAFFSAKLANDLWFGMGISSPFGLATEYDRGWIGQNQSLKSSIKTINVNPSLAWRANDTVSVGVGLNYQKINAELTNALYSVKGDDTAWGWNAGALFTLSPAMRVGLSYRSAIKYTLEGTMTTSGGLSMPAKADVKLPGTFILSVWQQVSDRWEAVGDFSYTRWSSLQSLNLVNPNTGGSLGSETFNYDNSWRLAWGAAYKAADGLKLKFGVAYDRTPVQDAYRSPRVPDENRVWLTLGGQWDAGRYGRVDVGYAYLHVTDPSINTDKNGVLLNGSYDANGHIVGVQYSVGF
jgi:long-chain fatty acid transport protein